MYRRYFRFDRKPKEHFETTMMRSVSEGESLAQSKSRTRTCGKPERENQNWPSKLGKDSVVKSLAPTLCTFKKVSTFWQTKLPLKNFRSVLNT